jgi:drug/metabolite transporter (DMT)-like permease
VDRVVHVGSWVVVSFWTAVFAALGCSLCGALANTLQHRTAVAVSGIEAAESTTVAMAVRATLTHRWWLMAVGLQGMGFLLHATALSFGQLTVVQPLLVCAVLFALPLNRVLRHEPITRNEVGWAAVLVVGLAGFLVVAAPPVTSGHEPVNSGNAVVAVTIGGVGIITCVLCARRWYGQAGSFLLATAAGIMFVGQAALLKSSVGVLSGGVGALLTAWQPYALIVVGGGAVMFSQLAFRAGSLAASLPVVSTVNPVLGVIVGATVYNESVRHSPLALAAESLFLLLLVAATVVLTRLEDDTPTQALSVVQD